jgi:hypothetical protein
MEFFVTSATPSRQRTDCAIVGVFEKGALSAAAEDLDNKLGGRLAKLANQRPDRPRDDRADRA